MVLLHIKFCLWKYQNKVKYLPIVSLNQVLSIVILVFAIIKWSPFFATPPSLLLTHTLTYINYNVSYSNTNIVIDKSVNVK